MALPKEKLQHLFVFENIKAATTRKFRVLELYLILAVEITCFPCVSVQKSDSYNNLVALTHVPPTNLTNIAFNK